MVVENQYPTRVEAPSPFGCGYAALCKMGNASPVFPNFPNADPTLLSLNDKSRRA
jgi:hypothetical protein